MSRPITMISPAGPIPGPTFGPRSEAGSRSLSPNMTSRAVRWGSGRAGEPLHPTSAFRQRAPQSSASKHSHRRSQCGWDSAAARRKSTPLLQLRGPRFFGSFATPESANPGTTTFGNYAHKEIAKLLQQNYPEANFIFRIRPGQIGPDVELVEQEAIDAVGFRYGEIKPLTNSGKSSFNRQVLNWDLADPVQPITYDAAGNVFWGFH
jgi:hypothetical protein